MGLNDQFHCGYSPFLKRDRGDYQINPHFCKIFFGLFSIIPSEAKIGASQHGNERNYFVVPAKAGIQDFSFLIVVLDSCFRRQWK
jgi:hypothetical protein